MSELTSDLLQTVPASSRGQSIQAAHDKHTDLPIMRIRAGTGSDTFILVFCKDYIQIDHEVL
ncbi:hypothetical protein [Paenibacillus lactis]|uniref:hypothetical protein n=1 Tax=Paenibacillus lactis TaxID=228574 RepID=UPI00110FDE5D|nr:hypothetical protein [Paenibacillus lactis]